MSNLKRPLIISVIAHIIILLLFSNGIRSCALRSLGVNTEGEKSEGFKGFADDNSTQIIPRLEPVIEVHIENTQNDNQSADKPAQKTSPNDAVKECPDNEWFAGIGIEYNPYTAIISTVFEGYPAEKMGVKVGDIIINIEDMGQKQTENLGMPFPLRIKRDGKVILFNLICEKICTNKRGSK